MARFACGWNQPGYLPESDPVMCDTFDEAKELITDELDRAADDAYTAGTSTNEFDEGIDTAEDWTDSDGPYWQLYADGYVYWINAPEE